MHLKMASSKILGFSRSGKRNCLIPLGLRVACIFSMATTRKRYAATTLLMWLTLAWALRISFVEVNISFKYELATKGADPPHPTFKPVHSYVSDTWKVSGFYFGCSCRDCWESRCCRPRIRFANRRVLTMNNWVSRDCYQSGRILLRSVQKDIRHLGRETCSAQISALRFLKEC